MDERFLSGLLAMALLMSTIMMSAIIIGVFIGIMYNVHASVSNAVTGDWCYDEGYRDGLAHPFNHITYDECSINGHSSAYHDGYIEGGDNIHAFVSNAVSADWCYDEGYRDGLAHPFNHITYDECGVYDHSDRYYEGFIGGCTRVEENTEDECHCATNPYPAEEKECQMWS